MVLSRAETRSETDWAALRDRWARKARKDGPDFFNRCVCVCVCECGALKKHCKNFDSIRKNVWQRVHNNELPLVMFDDIRFA